MKKVVVKIIAFAFTALGFASVVLAHGPTGSGGLP
jgi:hypothetical protein